MALSICRTIVQSTLAQAVCKGACCCVEGEWLSYLNLITFYSNNSLDKDRVLLPKVLLLLKCASSRVEDDNITSFWIPGSQQIM